MNVLETMKKYNKKATFGVQITSMVDMMTILLAFLLNQQSSSSAQITPIDGLTLPTSTTAADPIEALKVTVSNKGVFVNEKKVADIENGKLIDSSLDAKDKMFIPALYDELDKEAENSKKIAKINETVEFEGKAVLIADSRLNYQLLKQVMYTATSAGFANIKLATMAGGGQ